jgi:hypothetical protein
MKPELSSGREITFPSDFLKWYCTTKSNVLMNIKKIKCKCILQMKKPDIISSHIAV